MTEPQRGPMPPIAAAALRLMFYAVLGWVGLMIFGPLLSLFGLWIGATLGVFTAAAVANAIAVRIFERGTLVDLGLGWDSGSGRNLWLGLSGGIGAALIVLGPPLLIGAARFEPDTLQQKGLGPAAFLTAILLFGAVGEELLFRGYGFQLLVGYTGRFATILPTAILFAAVHLNNANVSTLGLVNTFGFGVVLGYSMVRSGDLWLPIGIHFGWNIALPLAGVNLSGFTMGVTGYALHWNVGAIWSGGAYGPEASILTSAVIVALLVYVQKAPIATHIPLLLRPRPEV
jgi:membrane protease YdiL (CAAX protease family)